MQEWFKNWMMCHKPPIHCIYSVVEIFKSLLLPFSSLLLEWKNSTNKKCIIIKGARQVGKTYLVRAFGKTEYENFGALILRVLLSNIQVCGKTQNLAVGMCRMV